MSLLRRGIQVVALVGTLLVGIIAVSLIVSQTAWFKDWLRRYVMRQSNQYLNGQLSIGRLGGNLFFGVDLSDVALDVSGERVVSVKDLQVDYSVFHFISRGLIFDDIKITEPRLLLRRHEDGSWNLASLVKEQEQEAGREGPARPVTIGSIGITNGEFIVEDNGAGHAVGTSGGAPSNGGVRMPERIEKLDAKLAFRYEPVSFTVVLDHLSFRTAEPDLDINRVQGTVAVRDDDLHLDEVQIHTGDSALHVDGVIQQYASRPVFKLAAASERVSLPEIGRVVPAVAAYRLHPSFEVTANGPLSALRVEANARSQAGEIDGEAVIDGEGPRRSIRGEVAVGGLDLAPLVKDPAQKSNITGRARMDVTFPESGIDGVRGTWQFAGPRVVAAGYEARNVNAKGELRGRQVTVDGRAEAYGGRATARGHVLTPTEGRPLEFSFAGQASGINLQRLPASLNVPRLATDLNAAYRVEGAAGRLEGEARLDRSVVEDATFADGTVASFSSTRGKVEYTAKGRVEDLNVQRLARGLRVEALNTARYDSDLDAEFDVRGSGTALESMTLDATGQLTDSRALGGRVPRLAFEAHIADGGLHARANGELAGFDPAALSGRAQLKGSVGGEVDVEARIPDLSEPLRPETIEGRARVALASSRIGEIDIERGSIDASAADGIAQVRDLTIEGADLDVKASGQVALTAGGTSDLRYHIVTPSLRELGALVGQPLEGGAILDGTATGTRAQLRTTGTIDGSNLSYGANGALDVNSTYDATIPDLQPEAARVGADIHATFVKLGGVEIQEVRAKTTYADKQVDFDATVRDRGRELQAKGDAVLHPDHSEIHLPSFSLASQGITWQFVGDAAAVQYGSNRVSFQNVKLQNGTQSLEVDGSIATGEDKPSGEVTVQAANVDLKQLQDLLLMDRGVTGELNADATLTGSLAAPTVEGEVAVVNGTFRDFTFESLRSKVNYTTAGIQVDARLQQTPEHWLTVTGFAPTSLFRATPGERAGHRAETAEDRVDLRVESSQIDLGVIQGFTTQVTDVRGTMQANLHVVGSGADPHAVGTIAIRQGAFSLPIGGTAYSGLDTTIELTKDKVIVPGFQVLDEEGHPLLVGGEISLHERAVGAVNLNMQADSFEIIDNELGDVGLDAILKISGELRRPRIEGDIRVENGRIEVDQVLAMVSSPYPTDVTVDQIEPGADAASSDTGAGQAAADALRAPQRHVEGAADAAAEESDRAESEPGPMDQLAMNVRVRIPNNLVLRGQGLRPGGPGGLAIGNVNATVGGDVRLTKKPGDTLRLVGAINTVRGFYEFQGRRFDVQRDGQIRFAGLDTLDPSLDILATRLISGVEARIRVRGTARAPELELSSNPPLDQADVLSLIVFNRSINDLNEGERVSLAQTAGAVASGFVAAPLAQSIGQALDVDLFEIEPTQAGGQMGAGITLGQQIGDRLFLKFHQEFGPQDASEFIIEYQLADFLRLQTTAAPGGGTKASRIALRRIERFGADLIFFFSY